MKFCSTLAGKLKQITATIKKIKFIIKTLRPVFIGQKIPADKKEENRPKTQ